MPFSKGNKQVFFVLKEKKEKENKKTKDKTKKANKEGLGTSEVALRAISPDP